MRGWLCGSALLTLTAFTVPGAALAQSYYGGPRDVYGNLLVVPGYGSPSAYEPGLPPVQSRRSARRDPRYAPIDPATGYPYGALPPDRETASLPYDQDIGGTIGMEPSAEFQRQVVGYRGRERAGTVIIDTPSKYLYLVQGDGTAIRYGIGVGRPGFEWAGRKTVSMKREWPSWRPPAEMIKRRPDLPRFMEGGPENPLGARALYLGSSLYRIHGTNEPHTIGQAVSSGCIRMLNRDVIDLYNRVPVGAQVVVI
ncbi:L,D-transpeptidase [Microvirga pudoricolor]|uniref:L,D-transpeptidase n=1 Tax=Microvirga pudoricolor TaxID=2778729 RepID=UPI001E4E9F2D|nr:L,D-transpeptidase [Microvirga pudoricolor]